MKRRPGNGIEGAMVCTSLGSLLHPLFHFLDDVSYPQSVQSCVKIFLLSFENPSQNVRLATPNCTMVQISASHSQNMAGMFLHYSVFAENLVKTYKWINT